MNISRLTGAVVHLKIILKNLPDFFGTMAQRLYFTVGFKSCFKVNKIRNQVT